MHYNEIARLWDLFPVPYKQGKGIGEVYVTVMATIEHLVSQTLTLGTA
jgi:hypothetical protein